VSLHGLRLLVVDDHADARRILRLVFEYCGADVFIAESGREALPVFERVRPHAVITDIAMPRWAGYRPLRSTRAPPAARGSRPPPRRSSEETMARHSTGFVRTRRAPAARARVGAGSGAPVTTITAGSAHSERMAPISTSPGISGRSRSASTTSKGRARQRASAWRPVAAPETSAPSARSSVV